ncbi:MAG: LLM class flavin-dependent oxidoreductase [Microthrixaceae bacterium]|nr:LLM class flavin-dependent oxidoreductase [Microthrixaceae bacterium]MCO5313769.1 LLM class flavin-dependent oxidoreductase [Microthrixaceae bacterium]
MEFGLFLNGYLPGPAAHNPGAEHEMLMREVNYGIHADKFNWKYVWMGEHHALTEYSHLSAPEVLIGYVAAKTEQIHIGSAIMNLSRPVNHPVRNAERVAMLDHITEGRYEWGTGRGAGSHEMATFDLLTSETKEMWDEAAHEILRMWEVRDYTFEGKYFKIEKPHNVLPKPYGTGHPPMWVGCGNPGTFTKAGELGIGAIAFNFEPIYNLKGRINAYKEGITNCTETLGQYKNDNVMMTNAVVCVSDRKRAREIAMSLGRGYLNTMVNMYHDTMPPQDNAVVWPNPPHRIPDESTLDYLIEAGYLLCGTPEEVNEQIAKYQEVGCDQLVFGIPTEGFRDEEILEMIELFGTEVIPNYDTDPEHSTTRYRREAKRKYPDFEKPVDPNLKVSVLPESALIQLPE